MTFPLFKSILCSCRDECGIPSKSPASTTFHEPNIESSVLAEEEASAAVASLSSSPGAHPLDQTTISLVTESSKQAAWWIRKPPSSASRETGLECCGWDWPRGATWTTSLPVPREADERKKKKEER